MMVGNLLGGATAGVALGAVQLAPSLVSLALIAFVIGALFASFIERGGAAAAVGLVTYNQAMVMFGLALMPGGADSGLWMARLLQFGIASMFAISRMALLLPGQIDRRRTRPMKGGAPSRKKRNPRASRAGGF